MKKWLTLLELTSRSESAPIHCSNKLFSVLTHLPLQRQQKKAREANELG